MRKSFLPCPTFLFALLSTPFACITVLASSPPPAQIMNQQAQQAMRQPVRIDVVSFTQRSHAGEPVFVYVTLHGGDGRPAAPSQAVTAEIQAVQPSGKIATVPVTFAPGESSERVELPISESGLIRVKVRQIDDHLLGSSTYIYIAPSVSDNPGKRKEKKRVSKEVGLMIPAGNPRSFGDFNRRKVLGRLLRVGYPKPPQVQGDIIAPAPTASASDAKLALAVSGIESPDGIPADGKTAARIQLFWIASDLPERDVQVWMQWSNGELSPNPIIISKQKPFGEASWTSKYPVAAATVGAVATNPPSLRFQGSSRAAVKFGDPILSLGFASPTTNISIVDTLSVTAMFFDPLGNPLKTASPKSVKFVTDSRLRLDPDHADGDFIFSTLVTPMFVGDSTITALSSGYRSAPYEVSVTYLSVALLCVVGGLLGGLLAYMNSGGKVLTRILSGVIVGAVASWAYVFVGLPNVQTAILHSQLSVLFVSLLASFGGVKVLSAISGKLNLGF